MKFNKKKVLVLSLVICLVAILSFGTLAWFNASDEVTNIFKVANSDDPDQTPNFSVEVLETQPDSSSPSSNGVEYTGVLPGDEISKDPTVKNTGDYDQWIRVAVTLDKAQGWADAGGTLNFKELFKGSTYGSAAQVATATEKWLLADEVATVTNDKATWYLYLNEKLSSNETEKVFTAVNIPTVFTQQDMAFINNEFSISIKAEALQAKNTGNNAVSAFDYVNWEAGKAYGE